jgi:hypothetical protein
MHANTDASVDTEVLYRKIGRLEAERDFLTLRAWIIPRLKVSVSVQFQLLDVANSTQLLPVPAP